MPCRRRRRRGRKTPAPPEEERERERSKRRRAGARVLRPSPSLPPSREARRGEREGEGGGDRIRGGRSSRGSAAGSVAWFQPLHPPPGLVAGARGAGALGRPVFDPAPPDQQGSRGDPRPSSVAALAPDFSLIRRTDHYIILALHPHT